MKETGPKPQRSQRELGSVGNALRLLELMAGTSASRVTDLADRLGVSKASVDRLLRTMVREGFVEQDPESRRYRLTFKLLVLAEEVRSRTGLVGLARPLLERLAAELGETVNLGVLLDGAVVYADTIPSGRPFRIEVTRGMSLPAYCTGAGKALLACLPAARLDSYLEHLEPARHTAATLTEIDAIRAELEKVRAQGFAIDRGELLEESRCVAAPVLTAAETAAAAISVTAPKSQFTGRREEIVGAVRAVATELSRRVQASGVRDVGGIQPFAAESAFARST